MERQAQILDEEYRRNVVLAEARAEHQRREHRALAERQKRVVEAQQKMQAERLTAPGRPGATTWPSWWPT